MIKSYSLIPLQKPLKQNENRTFADNWLDTMDSIMQLVISNEIWERQDAEPSEQIVINSRVFQPQEGLKQTVYYLNDEPVMMLSKSLGTNPEIPLHYTLVI